MHIMDDIHGIDVDTGQPVHHLLELADHVIEVEELATNSTDRGPDLFTCKFVSPTVNRIEEAFGQIGSGAEELHLFSHEHG